jgi:hypothetical protein
MPSKHFVITREYQPARCEICHQVDCFDADQIYCARCHALANSITVNALQPVDKPLLVELYEQTTLFQIVLTLLLGGILTGLMIDAAKFDLEFSLIFSFLISMSAALPLTISLNREQQPHPLLLGLLTTLTIAPLGWPLLTLLNWLAHILS